MGVYIRWRFNRPFDTPAVATTLVSDEILVLHFLSSLSRAGNVLHGQTSLVMKYLYP